ncbi:MAG: amidase [Promethearchaeota archaeon]|nr:MAG: amidase [Candidatus Lokiarchaeota archaeon]
MSKEDICYMSACDMAERIRTQEFTSAEITETIIERIEEINPIINAYCTPTFDLAREMAKKADDAVKRGEKIGKLNGIPTSIKDIIETEEIRTTYGSKLYENFIPKEDAIVVKRLKDAGIVILGKTNTPEFAFSPVTDNPIFGETKNPWNLERTTGGSTGGGAAATASGLGPLTLGSDAGGSIRIPSCFCGTFGLKPSFGRIPTYPYVILHSRTINHYGPLVRYVEDAALMLDAMKGPDDRDRLSLPEQNISYLDNIDNKPSKLKIGYSLDLGYVKALDPEVERNILNSIDKFSQFSWDAEKAKIKLRKAEWTYNILYTVDYGYDLKPKLKDWKESLDPNFLKLVEAGLGYSGIDVMRAMDQRRKLYDSINEVFNHFDVLITPTLALPAFELGRTFPAEVNGKGLSPTGWLFTFPFNLTGHPAASIPCGWSGEGLPIGMQIVGKRFDEVTVLQVSKAFQDIAPWQEKRPNL